ncbi:hypothetical protein CEN41_03710, partial [Fischerella thermalis CCMEE 5330]
LFILLTLHPYGKPSGYSTLKTPGGRLNTPHTPHTSPSPDLPRGKFGFARKIFGKNTKTTNFCPDFCQDNIISLIVIWQKWA